MCGYVNMMRMLTQCSQVRRAIDGVECILAQKGCVQTCVEDAKRPGCTCWKTGTMVTLESALQNPLCVLYLVLLWGSYSLVTHVGERHRPGKCSALGPSWDYPPCVAVTGSTWGRVWTVYGAL